MFYLDTLCTLPLLQLNQIETTAGRLPAELCHRVMRETDVRARALRVGGYILLERMTKKHLAPLAGGLASIVKPAFASLIGTPDFLSAVRYDSLGKPYFDGIESASFNLSHNAHLAACGLFVAENGGTAPLVGVDVQRQIDDVEKAKRLAARYFTANEQRKLEETCEDGFAYRLLFTQIWSKKEALVKCTGDGLSKIREADSTAPEAFGCRFEESRQLSVTVSEQGREKEEIYFLSACVQNE